MKTKRISLLLVIFGVVVLASIVGAQPGLQGGGKFKLEGSWELEIKPAPGSGLPPSIKALATFDSAGGCVETILLPPVVVPAHGAWEKTGSRESVFAVVHHLVDQNGHFTGTVRARSAVTFTSRDEFTAVFDGTLFDPNGNAIAPIAGTETGKRVSVE